MTKRLHILLFQVFLAGFLLMTASAGAVFVEDRLADPELEARAREISEEIRCLVCQNQSIMDSNADLAKDLRGVVRERVQAGDTDDQVRQYLVDRYGDWVLLNPPFKLRTLLLWIGPFLFLGGGAIGVFLFLRRKSDTGDAADAVTPLSEEEHAEIDRLLVSADEEGRR